MDLSNPNASVLPALVLDIAAPESLGPNTIAPLDVDGHSVAAYTLERIVGEKLRAFLSSLPTHRRKLDGPGDAVRAKDVFDIACVERDCPVGGSTQLLFWQAEGTEFQLACASVERIVRRLERDMVLPLYFPLG